MKPIPIPKLILPDIKNMIVLNDFLKKLSVDTKRICDKLQ